MTHFEYNKIYYGRYFPKGYGQLPVFDQYPLIIPLKIMGPTMLACNLHWVPGIFRYKFILALINMYNRLPDKTRFRIWYQTMKMMPALALGLTGVRRYYVMRLSNVVEIPGEKWEDLPILSTSLYKARFLQRHSQPINIYKRKRM